MSFYGARQAFESGQVQLGLLELTKALEDEFSRIKRDVDSIERKVNSIKNKV